MVKYLLDKRRRHLNANQVVDIKIESVVMHLS